MHRRNDKAKPLRRRRRMRSRASGAARRCTSRRFFLLLLRRALALLELRLLPSASPVLSLHLFWTCGAGSRRSASLPGHAASNEENSTRLRGAQSHKSTADPSDPRKSDISASLGKTNTPNPPSPLLPLLPSVQILLFSFC
jgi:hypothetical protein